MQFNFMNKKYFDTFYLDFSRKSRIETTTEGDTIEKITIKCVPVESQILVKKIFENKMTFEHLVLRAQDFFMHSLFYLLIALIGLALS